LLALSLTKQFHLYVPSGNVFVNVVELENPLKFFVSFAVHKVRLWYSVAFTNSVVWVVAEQLNVIVAFAVFVPVWGEFNVTSI
jgi:hypothetical protein